MTVQSECLNENVGENFGRIHDCYIAKGTKAFEGMQLLTGELLVEENNQRFSINTLFLSFHVMEKSVQYC